MLEHESLQGISSMKPTGFRKRSNSMYKDSETYTISSILQELSIFYSSMSHHGMEQSLTKQAIKQLFYLIGATTFNQIMLRKDMCSCRKGMQIRFVACFRSIWMRVKNGNVVFEGCSLLLDVTSVTWKNGWRRMTFRAPVLLIHWRLWLRLPGYCRLTSPQMKTLKRLQKSALN